MQKGESRLLGEWKAIWDCGTKHHSDADAAARVYIIMLNGDNIGCSG